MLVRAGFLFLLAIFAFTFQTAAKAQAAQKTIYAIMWRGCEDACQGFKDYITASGIEVEIIIRDAARDKSQLPGFLDEARSLSADVILTWGTSVTRGIAGTLSDKDNPKYNHNIPLVFTIVSDPVGASIVESLDKTGRPNITGTYNRVPEVVNINTLKTYNPKFKRLGLLYNIDEHNAVAKHQELKFLAKEMGFELIALPINLDDNEKPIVGDIAVKIRQLKEAQVDFVYLGSSSFLRANRDVFTASAVENGLPVLSPYEQMVRESDALISVAARYYDVGQLAGQQVEKILLGDIAAGDIPVARIKDFAYVINMEVAKKLDQYPPVIFFQFAEIVKK